NAIALPVENNHCTCSWETVASLISPSSMLFFFSSRRRHKRWPRDWSSDVCSSDLKAECPVIFVGPAADEDHRAFRFRQQGGGARSEERRVGKEWRSRRAPSP